MPVLIQIPLQDPTKVSNGTGLYLTQSNKMFLVTAAHCIFNVSSTNNSDLLNSAAVLSSFTRDEKTNKQVVHMDLRELKQHGLIKRHPTHDVTVLQIATLGTPQTNGTPIYWSSGVVALTHGKLVTWAAGDETIPSSAIPDASDVYILGYPVELLANHQYSEVDFDSPLTRRGILSQRNNHTGKLIIDSGVYGGNSGGPVLIVQRPALDRTEFRIGALITQFVPASTRIYPQAGITNSVLVNSGYGVAEPIDFALELIAQYPEK